LFTNAWHAKPLAKVYIYKHHANYSAQLSWQLRID